MNAKMKIKFENKTIEISKAFANKASVYGSEEYHTLRAAVQDLPDFKVVIKAASVSQQTFMKGMTYDYMESYITSIDTDGSIMEQFRLLRQRHNYAVVKKWFVNLVSTFNERAA